MTTVAHSNTQVKASGHGITLFCPASESVWTNHPDAVTEFLGLTAHRQLVNVQESNFARIVAYTGSVAGDAGSTLRVQYSLDAASTWASLTNTTTVTATATVTASTWLAIPEAVKAAGDVLVRIVGAGGDGAVDPVFGVISLQFAR